MREGSISVGGPKFWMLKTWLKSNINCSTTKIFSSLLKREIWSTSMKWHSLRSLIWVSMGILRLPVNWPLFHSRSSVCLHRIDWNDLKFISWDNFEGGFFDRLILSFSIYIIQMSCCSYFWSLICTFTVNFYFSNLTFIFYW